MKLFVTGGAGFIGSNFVRQQVGKGHRLTVFDSLTYAGNLDNLSGLQDHANYQFVHGDIREELTVLEAMKGSDVVVHFAAESHVDRSINNPHVFVDTNCVGTSVVMKCALENDVSKVVHISTDETYGSIDNGSFAETSALGPRSPYSASKAGSDLLTLSYGTTYGLPVVVTRASNNFGPYQHIEKLIPKFITNLMENKKVPLMGEGGNTRDWLFVEDHCNAIETVIEHGVAGEIYNVGGGCEKTNLEITSILLDIFGKSDDFIEPIADRLGHDWRYSIDSSKMKSLGWHPQIAFENGIDLTVDWYRNNQSWWKQLKSEEVTEALKK